MAPSAASPRVRGQRAIHGTRSRVGGTLLYGVAADVFSFGALAYECFYYRANGEDFYEGMTLFTGLDVFREPVTSDPQQMPERPSACEDDAVWKCICDCLTTNPAKRPAAAAATAMMRTHLSSTGDDKWLSSGA